MKTIWNTIQFTITTIGGWLGYFLGGLDGLVFALVVFVAIDYANTIDVHLKLIPQKWSYFICDQNYLRRHFETSVGTEFTYKFISDKEKCPFEKELAEQGIEHKLIKPATPWHNGKVERSHRMDERYFYEWETFKCMEDFNGKLREHLEWTNTKPM